MSRQMPIVLVGRVEQLSETQHPSQTKTPRRSPRFPGVFFCSEQGEEGQQKGKTGARNKTFRRESHRMRLFLNFPHPVSSVVQLLWIPEASAQRGIERGGVRWVWPLSRACMNPAKASFR